MTALAARAGRMRGMRDELPPGVYRTDQADPAGDGPIKPDAKDFLALVIAVYQILLPPLLALIGALVGVYLLVLLLARANGA